MGGHDELLAQKGEFARLYALQFEKQEKELADDDEVLLN